MRSAAARLAQFVRRRLAGNDEGFLLLESVMAMAVISIVMAAVGAELITSTITTSKQRGNQVAVQVASTTMEQIRALHASDLVVGRDSASVAAEFGAASASVQPWLANMDAATDPSAAAGAGTAATIPTSTTTQKPGSISYGVTQYLGWCYIPLAGSTNCVPKAQITATSFYTFLRAVVAVSWQQSNCPATGCTFVTSTLVSVAGDSTFQVNQSLPPAPTIVDPGAQAVSVGDAVSLQLTTLTGVPPYVWTSAGGSLPGGLTLSPGGLISGTVTGSTGSFSSTIKVTDAFLRSATITITWTVTPTLAVAQPADQTTTTGTAVSLPLSASGGTNSGYTWSLKSGPLPTGLTLNSSTGVISGTATSAGAYPVTVQVKDSGNHVATASFTWTTKYPPLVVSGATINATVGNAVSTSVTATGGSGSYSWSLTSGSLPDGLSLNTATGAISGTPTRAGAWTATVSVTDTAGTSASASVTATIASATLGALAPQNVTEGAAVSAPLTYTCPTTSCTLSASGLPPGLTLSKTSVTSGSGTVNVSGTVSSTAVASTATSAPYTITVTLTSGSTSTATTSAWTAYAAPTVSVSGADVAETATPSIPVTVTCPNTPCTVALANGVPGLGLSKSQVNASPNTTATVTVNGSTGTVYINGYVSTNAVTAGSSKGYTPVVTIIDASAVSSSAPSNWTAWTQPVVSSPDGKRVTAGSAIAPQQLGYSCPVYYGLFSSCTISVAGQPSGVGLSATSTGVARGSVAAGGAGSVYLIGTPASAASGTTPAVTVTIVDNYGGVSTSSVGTWTVQ